jgi:hypothetical protein
MRKQIATIAVAALLVFAGCSAGGDGAATTTAPEPTGDAPTTTTAGSGGDAVYESPLDAATVADNHASLVRDANTFTLVSTSNQSQGPQTITVESSIAANLESGEYYSVQNASGQTVEVYSYGNGTAYQRTSFGSGDTSYSTPRQTTNTSQLAGTQVESFVNAFTFSHAGTESVDGAEAHVYEASGVETLNESAPGFSGLDTENVTSIDAHVYITDDGLVKQFEYSLAVDTQNGEASISVRQQYVDVGSTTVEAPAWLDEARENASA